MPFWPPGCPAPTMAKVVFPSGGSSARHGGVAPVEERVLKQRRILQGGHISMLATRAPHGATRASTVCRAVPAPPRSSRVWARPGTARVGEAVSEPSTATGSSSSTKGALLAGPAGEKGFKAGLRREPRLSRVRLAFMAMASGGARRLRRAPRPSKKASGFLRGLRHFPKGFF